jgi:hypothetical protein
MTQRVSRLVKSAREGCDRVAGDDGIFEIAIDDVGAGPDKKMAVKSSRVHCDVKVAHLLAFSDVKSHPLGAGIMTGFWRNAARGGRWRPSR